MSTKKHLSDEWEFVKPLSIRTEVQLIQFKSACAALEDFLSENGITVKKFKFHGTDYNSFLFLELAFEDYESLKNKRWDFYRFLHRSLPVNFRKIDWFDDTYIQQSLSRLSQLKDEKRTNLILVLDYCQYKVEFPSHDFICMSEDLVKAKAL
jgi:hypothetical protein